MEFERFIRDCVKRYNQGREEGVSEDLRMALGMSWEDAMSVNADLKKTVIAGLKLWFRASPSIDVEEIFHVLSILYRSIRANSIGIGFVSK